MGVVLHTDMYFVYDYICNIECHDTPMNVQYFVPFIWEGDTIVFAICECKQYTMCLVYFMIESKQRDTRELHDG